MKVVTFKNEVMFKKALYNTFRDYTSDICNHYRIIKDCGDCVFSKAQVCWKFGYYIDTINNYVR